MKTKTIVTAIMAGAISVMPVVAQTLSEKSNRSTRDVSRRVDAGRTKKAKSGLREVRKMRQHIAPVLSGKLGAAPASGYVPNLRGSVNFSNLMNNPYADFQVGLYDVPSHEHEFDRIFAGPDASLGGVVKDGIYYCANMEDYVFVQFFHLYAYDMATGQLIASSGNVTGDLSCMGSGGYALDPVSGDVYGITLNRTGEGFQLSKVDFSIEGEKLRATSTKIGDLQGRYNAFAIDPEGQFYGIRYDLMDVSGGQAVTGSGLYKINRETAEETRIGATGYAPFYNSSATIDPESGRMFWTLSPADESGWLMEVDLATGQATPVIKYENSEEITGLYVAGNNDAKAPAYLTGVEANFEGPSLSGTIKMHTPALLVDGTPGSGTLDVKVYAGDKLLATASAVAYGADVEVPVTVEAPGLYDLKMVPVNAAGEGPAAKIRKKYLGKDYPRTPEVTLTYQNGFMQIDWNAVNSSQHGGYMDASNIYYRVERVASNKPEGVVIAGALTTNQFGETITPTDELVYYRYAVYPVADGMVGEPGYSNSVKTGTIVYPPFTSDLTTGMQEYTVVDGNNDKRYWVWLDQLGAAGISYHETNKMNDWLISPVVKLEGGKAYKIDLKAYADRAMFPERIEIFAGRQPKAASMTMPVMGPTDIDWEASDMKVVDGMLAVKETGDYYIGFHAISDPNTSAIYLKEWSIAECSSAYAPAAAAGLTVTPNAEFGLSAEISFTAPSVDMLGDELRGLNGLEVRRDGVRVQSWRDPQPGESYTFTDEVPKTGWYEYSVIASNKDGEGQPAKVKVFIGITRPGALESCTISRTDTDGEVRLDWTPVTVGEDGRPMNPDLVKYNIYTFNNLGLEVLLMEGVEGSSYTFQAIKPGRQDFVQCVVYPVTATGEGGGQVTEMIPVGTPYPGIEETFADGKLHYVWGAEASNDNVRYGVYTTADSQITAVNNDNGFFAMQGSKENDYVDFFTGMINLAGMESPGVSLYVLNMGSESGANDNHNQVMIYVRDVQGGDCLLYPSPSPRDAHEWRMT
ncbi:MAG: hypothetical protein K2M87_04120, partial [Muribaculaceae bacterium]|nr:hypothetical protein [Muribaculaceae bacterium]